MIRVEAYRQGRKVGQWHTLTVEEARAIIARGNVVGSYTHWELWTAEGCELFSGNSV